MLNDTQCRNAKTKDKPYKLADAKGLHLEVKPTGAKVWRYRFKLATESVFTIGDYAPAPTGETAEQAQARRAGRRFTLSEAREERTKARALVKQGINPAQHRQGERDKRLHESATTCEAVAAEWLALKDWEAVTKAKRLEMLKRVVFPAIGALPIKQVTPAHVLAVLKAAAENNGVSVMAEAKRTLYGIFELAAETFRIDANPVHRWREALPTNKTQHKRPLSAAEVGQLLRDLAGYERNYQTVAAFRLMWLTLCRPNEVMGARWDEIDLDAAVWRIPAERMKKRKEHVVPLPRQAVELLRTVQGFTGHRGHVFPNRDNRNRPMTDAALRQAGKYLGWSGKYSPHATRTTGSTRLNEMGFTSDWIERQLAHVEPNSVRRTYNHADYFNDRAKMMQQWADTLDSWESGAQVIPLHGNAA